MNEFTRLLPKSLSLNVDGVLDFADGLFEVAHT